VGVGLVVEDRANSAVGEGVGIVVRMIVVPATVVCTGAGGTVSCPPAEEPASPPESSIPPDRTYTPVTMSTATAKIAIAEVRERFIDAI